MLRECKKETTNALLIYELHHYCPTILIYPGVKIDTNEVKSFVLEPTRLLNPLPSLHHRVLDPFLWDVCTADP
jgi:hypothetical protein